MKIAPATTIDEVLFILDQIMDWAIERNSRLGYFPALYRRVTQRVKDGIGQNEFTDNALMERLDIIFANRYIMAFDAYLNQNGVVPASWEISFQAANSHKPLVLQHLLAGMNAHIHFDLGLAAAETMQGAEIEGIKQDFFKINQVLGNMIDEVQLDLAEFWVGFNLLDRLGGRLDERFAAFGIKLSRDKAWKVATQMAMADPDERATITADLDVKISLLGQKILYPFWLWPGSMLMIAKLVEKKDVRNNIECLRFANT